MHILSKRAATKERQRTVTCVGQLSFVQPVTNVPAASLDLPVGARLHQLWETWEALGANPKVIKILKEGHALPFQNQPNLTRSPTIISCCVNPPRNLYLTEALQVPMTKKCSKTGQKSEILSVFHPTIVCPKTKQTVETPAI